MLALKGGQPKTLDFGDGYLIAITLSLGMREPEIVFQYNPGRANKLSASPRLKANVVHKPAAWPLEVWYH